MSFNLLLDICNLNVSAGNKVILNGLNLSMGLGEVHVIMGPNGAGKSTLARVLAGDYSNYSISGSILYDKCELLSLTPDNIALRGVFLSFQHPVEILGLSNFQFFKSLVNVKRKYDKLDPIDTGELLFRIKKFMKVLGIKEEFLYRSVNDNFSGGEKKRNEILQMLLLEPKFVILDEIDSGLDVDSLSCVFKCINTFKCSGNSMLIITHYNRVLDYIDVDFVHILRDGSIVKTGKKDLAVDIINNGYSTDSIKCV